jgi:hypothetical protein
MAKRVKPLIFGYFSARAGLSDEHLMEVRVKLTAFASDEGFALAGMFAEPAAEPATGLQALLDSAARRDVAAVAVPSITDLGPDPRVQLAARQRLEGAGIRVLVLVGGVA